MRYTSSITPAQGGVTIKDGWNGTRVYLVRKHFGIDGPTSKLGTYDTATKARVLAFQKERGLPATGPVDEATERPGYRLPLDHRRLPGQAEAAHLGRGGAAHRHHDRVRPRTTRLPLRLGRRGSL